MPCTPTARRSRHAAVRSFLLSIDAVLRPQLLINMTRDLRLSYGRDGWLGGFFPAGGRKCREGRLHSSRVAGSGGCVQRVPGWEAGVLVERALRRAYPLLEARGTE